MLRFLVARWPVIAPEDTTTGAVRRCRELAVGWKKCNWRPGFWMRLARCGARSVRRSTVGVLPIAVDFHDRRDSSDRRPLAQWPGFDSDRRAGYHGHPSITPLT